MRRRVVEADGTVHEYSYNPVLGVGLSLGVGFLSSLLGIGGGIIHVPVMANLLHALHLYDATRFAAALERGLNFIEKTQAADGSWSRPSQRSRALTLPA